jgi:hypothetical protein
VRALSAHLDSIIENNRDTYVEIALKKRNKFLLIIACMFKIDNELLKRKVEK